MSVLVDEHGDKQYKVMIAVPSGDDVKADFAFDLARLMGYTTFVRPRMTVLLYAVKGTYLPRARAALVKAALEHACSHILWLDADMRFPKDTLIRLIGHDMPIVAANYPTRQAPILPTALDTNLQPVFEREGMIDVRCCGMGVMLTDVDVFTAIGLPYFAVGYNRGIDDYAGEDTYFCERARACGYRVVIDGPLSEEVSHVGGFAYHLDHARLTLDAAVAAGA